MLNTTNNSVSNNIFIVYRGYTFINKIKMIYKLKYLFIIKQNYSIKWFNKYSMSHSNLMLYAYINEYDEINDILCLIVFLF